MSPQDSGSPLPVHAHCCPGRRTAQTPGAGSSRREFLATTGGFGLLGTALTGLSWSMMSASESR